MLNVVVHTIAARVRKINGQPLLASFEVIWEQRCALACGPNVGSEGLTDWTCEERCVNLPNVEPGVCHGKDFEIAEFAKKDDREIVPETVSY